MRRQPDEDKKEEEQPLNADAEDPVMEEEANSTNDAIINPAIDPGMGEPMKEEMMM